MRKHPCHYALSLEHLETMWVVGLPRPSAADVTGGDGGGDREAAVLEGRIRDAAAKRDAAEKQFNRVRLVCISAQQVRRLPLGSPSWLPQPS